MTEQIKKGQLIEDTRREFLRKSVYAAYATPIITALLVSQASAAVSTGSNKGQCQKAGGNWIIDPSGSGQSCCDLPPLDGQCG